MLFSACKGSNVGVAGAAAGGAAGTSAADGVDELFEVSAGGAAGCVGGGGGACEVSTCAEAESGPSPIISSASAIAGTNTGRIRFAMRTFITSLIRSAIINVAPRFYRVPVARGCGY